MIFSYEKLQHLNAIDSRIYNFIVKNETAVADMKVRELADTVHVSSASVVRFCEKMGYKGFSELRFALRQELEGTEATSDAASYDASVPLADFFLKVNSESFSRLIDEAIGILKIAPIVIFYGQGTGKGLAEYGARYWSNAGRLAVAMSDRFQPFPRSTPLSDNTTIVVLSASGENTDVLQFVNNVRQRNVKIISVTNSSHSALAKIADLNISYYMPEVKHAGLNLTTQVPVLYLIELIGNKLDEMFNM